MNVTSARLQANRRNAAQSTGPKTLEGKDRSRRNSLKHGMTGEGVVLPEADVSKVSQRFAKLRSQLQPGSEAGEVFLHRFAFLSVRLEKCEEFDTGVMAKRVRRAVAVYDDARLTAMETLVAMMPADPMTAARRLQQTGEGIDWLVRQWDGLRNDLMIEHRLAWTLNHWTQLEQLLGHAIGNTHAPRSYALTQAVCGFFVFLEPGEGEGLEDPERIERARTELRAIIDDEVARLDTVRAALDPVSFELDRVEAPSRALFDPAPEMNLARKYEAATERAMYKALNQFHEVEAAAIEAEPIVTNSIIEETCDTMGSFFPGSQSEVQIADELAATRPRPASRVGSRSSSLNLPAAKPTNQVPISIGKAGPEVT